MNDLEEKMFCMRSCFFSNPSSRRLVLKNALRSMSLRSYFAEPKMKTYVIAAALGASLGTAYALKTFKSETDLFSKLNNGKYSRDASTAIKEVKFGQNLDNPLDLTVFECHACLQCAKVRAFLSYYGMDYDSVEVNCLTRREVKWSMYKILPILYVHNENMQVNDSNVILSAFQSVHANPALNLKSVLPLYVPEISRHWLGATYKYAHSYDLTVPDSDNNEVKWRKWVDEQLIPVVSLTLTRTLKRSVESFKSFAEKGEWHKNFGSFQCNAITYMGAIYMYLKNRRKQNVYRDTFYSLMKVWTETLHENAYNGGDAPNLADLSVYGVLSSVEDCINIEELCSENIRFAKWWNSMRDLVCSHAGAKRHEEIAVEKTVSDSLPSMLMILLTFTAAKFFELAVIAGN